MKKRRLGPEITRTITLQDIYTKKVSFTKILLLDEFNGFSHFYDIIMLFIFLVQITYPVPIHIQYT